VPVITKEILRVVQLFQFAPGAKKRCSSARPLLKTMPTKKIITVSETINIHKTPHRKNIGNAFFKETKDMANQLCDNFEKTSPKPILSIKI